jgi:hypothetical protein
MPARPFARGALSFEGSYDASHSGCDQSVVKKRRHEAEGFYSRKKYTEAKDLLAALEAKCGDHLSSEDRGWVANDLALSFHKLGDAAGCRQALEPIRPLVDTYEANNGSLDGLGYPDFKVKALIRVAKAGQTNRKLCARGAKKR